MFPVIRNGDRVELEPLGEADPARGDILLAMVPGGDGASVWVLHRLVYRDHEGVFTVQGDNRLYPDLPITRAQIVARATRVVGPLPRPLRWSPRVAEGWMRAAPWMARITRRVAARLGRARS